MLLVLLQQTYLNYSPNDFLWVLTMPIEKEIEKNIEEILTQLTAGMIEGAEKKANCLTEYALEVIEKNLNGIPLSKYKELHHPVHWYLKENEIIDVQQSRPTGEQSYWFLSDGNGQNPEYLAKEIYKENELFLKCRYMSVWTKEAYDELLTSR